MKTRNKKNWNSLSMARKVNLELSFKNQSVTQNGGFPRAICMESSRLLFAKKPRLNL